MKKLSAKSGIYVLLIGALCAFFWSYSRYPGLLKRQMKGTSSATQAWSFDILWVDNPNADFMERVGGNFVNWCVTNWKGMTFGVLLATLLLGLFQQLRKGDIRNPWLRTLLGAGMGAPLGLCANCATPVGLGMRRSGFSMETAAALIIASPTLNAVALAMALGMFPPLLAGMKIVGTLFVIALIPLFIGLGAGKSASWETAPPATIETKQSVGAALGEVLRELGLHFLQVLGLAFPLMLLSGFLGALLFEVLPRNWFVGLEPSFLNVLLVSVVGTLAPVPMTFDVVFSAKLMETGLSPVLVMPALFSLGIFSFYPLLVMWRDFSPRLAMALFASVVMFAMASAGVASLYLA